jgi:hypothetical protein
MAAVAGGGSQPSHFTRPMHARTARACVGSRLGTRVGRKSMWQGHIDAYIDLFLYSLFRSIVSICQPASARTCKHAPSLRLVHGQRGVQVADRQPLARDADLAVLLALARVAVLRPVGVDLRGGSGGRRAGAVAQAASGSGAGSPGHRWRTRYEVYEVYEGTKCTKRGLASHASRHKAARSAVPCRAQEPGAAGSWHRPLAQVGRRLCS